MGLELILGSLGIKALMLVGGAIALLATYFGIKRRGVTQERTRQRAAEAQAEIETLHRLNDARRQDAELDRATQQTVEESHKPAPPQPRPDRFKFVWLLPLLFLTACAAVPVSSSVPVDIPARPMLEACPPAPHPEAAVRGGEVILSRPDAEAIASYLHRAPLCFNAREQQLLGHIGKLENRLKALGGS